MSAGQGPELELLRLVCSTRASRQRAGARIAALAAQADEMTLAEVCVDQRMLLLAAARLEESAPAGMSKRLREAVVARHAAARPKALAFGAALRHLTAELEAEGIASVPLKGPLMAQDLYGDAALREYTDLDVLVGPDDLERAVAVAGRVGWTERVVPPDPAVAGRPNLHHALRHPGGALPELELHWRVHWYEERFASEALTRAAVGPDGMRRLAPIDELAFLLLFFARDGLAGLRLAADVGAWWDRRGDGATIDGLRALIVRHPALAEPWRAAMTSATAVAGLPVEPARVDLVPHGRRAQLAVRLANWRLDGDLDQVMATVTLVDWLLAPAGEWRAFAGRHGFGLRRAGHTLKTAARCGVGLWHVRRAGVP